jgi:hypothetical protein
MAEVQELFEAVTGGRPLPPPRPRPRTGTRLLRVHRPRRRVVPACAAGAVLLALGVVIGTALVPDASTPIAAPLTSTPSVTPPVPPLTTTTTPADLGCSAGYAVTTSWPGGYQVQVTVRNDHTTGLRGWRVRWSLPDGHHIAGLWNGTFTVDGKTVTVDSADWNAKLDAGGSTTFGFNAVTGNGDATSRPQLTCRTV